jgi:hypothetical protein
VDSHELARLKLLGEAQEGVDDVASWHRAVSKHQVMMCKPSLLKH